MLSNLKTRFERNLIYVSLGLASPRTCLDSNLRWLEGWKGT